MVKDIDIREIQKDVGDYVSRKYGVKFKIAGLNDVPEPDKGGDESAMKNMNINEKKAVVQFDMKPAELKAYLDEYLVRQDEAKQVLATKICTHFNRIKRFERNRKTSQTETVGEIKNNIIMIGPTGVGKTFLVKLIADKIGVPFVKGDATKFSETGYVGGDVEDLVRELVREAGGDIELAQYGIVYLDEVDKIASSRNLIGPDVSRTGVQRALLKLLEETEVELKVPHDPIAQVEAFQEYQRTGKRKREKINTKHILFVVSGAFGGLDAIIQKRLNQQGIGFGADVISKERQEANLRYLKAEDLIQYGFESEFIGRLPVTTVFEYLDIEDLYKILRNPKSPVVIRKKRDFKAYDIDLLFTDDALRKIAENAFHERTGARGLVSAIERVLMKYEHVLPSTDIRQLLVTTAIVDDPEGELDKILNDPDNAERKAAFDAFWNEEAEHLKQGFRKKLPEWKETYGINLPESRIGLLVRQVMERQTNMELVLEEIRSVYLATETFAREFSNRNDLDLSFADEAVDCLAEKIWQKGEDPEHYLVHFMTNYDHGLNLVREKTGRRQFVIPPEGVENPELFLNNLIKKTYGRG
ncbi:MAG: AAA family ATPase [Deltaproteobacteria bacterium]|nr:AAA family ATPase [Deltaproteobacteria bacterium]